MSRPLRSVIDTPRCPNTRPAPALMTMAMPAITAKAAKRLPLTPHCGRRKPGPGNLPTVIGNAMLSASRSRSSPGRSRRQYRVTRLTKSGTFAANAQNLRIGRKKGRHKAGLFRESVQVRSGSIPRDHRATPVEAIVDASLNRMLVVAEAGSNEDRRAAGHEGGAAEVVILVFNLGGPAGREHVFEAGADTEDPGGGELIIEAALHAAEKAAIIARDAVVARERAADVATDVEAGPVVDRRAVSRRLGVGTSRHISRQCRRGCAEGDEGHSTE